MTKKYLLGLLFSLCILLLNACSGELTFEEANDILSKHPGTINIYLPSTEARYIKYKDDNNTIFDKLAAEGYLKITEDSERPSNSQYDRRVYYRVRLTDKLTPYIAGQSLVKIGNLDVAKIMGIKRVPADESLRVVEFTTNFIPNTIGKMISLRNRNMQIQESKCIFKKHSDGWRLELMLPDFVSRTEALADDMIPTDVRVSAEAPGVGTFIGQAPATVPEPSGDKDIFSVEGAEQVCHTAVLSMAVRSETMKGIIIYYVKTADRTHILPYKDRFKRYGHRFCFDAHCVNPEVKIGLSRSILCSIYKVGNDWKYDLQDTCDYSE